MKKQYQPGLGVKPRPGQMKVKKRTLGGGRIWIILDRPARGLRITNGNKAATDVMAGRYQARPAKHPISPSRNTLEIYDNEQNPAYVVVETLPGQGVNLTIEDDDGEDVGEDIGIPP